MKRGLTRRQALATIGAATLPAPVLAATPTLRAAPAQAPLLPKDAPETPVWAYEGSVPGPELRLRRGERLTRRFVNDLPQASSIHWHGIRLPNAMDGVAGVTQPAVEPGGAFTYDFTVPDAGTYWYHPHNRTYEQMARGLYGPLIIEETTPPDVDADLTLMLDDWRLTRTGAISDDFGRMHDLSHGGRIGNWVTVNGVGEWTHPAGRNARLRLRLINAANARIFTLGMQGLEGWVVALDGMPLAVPEPADRIELAPAQRADLIVDLTGAEEGVLYSIERDGGYAVAAFPVTGTVRAARQSPPDPLAPNDMPDLGGVAAAPLATMRMDGGAMGRMNSARMDGQDRDIRELVQAGFAWSLAGDAGMPKAPFLDVKLGEVHRIALVNDTAWPHGMHLHGHHFREVTDGQVLGPWRDTLLVHRGQTREIVFRADNPGDWLLHCHMLEHAAAGMMNWIRVS